jgi:hypothetical protein
MEQAEGSKVHNTDWKEVGLVLVGFGIAIKVKSIKLSHALNQLHPVIIGILQLDFLELQRLTFVFCLR